MLLILICYMNRVVCIPRCLVANRITIECNRITATRMLVATPHWGLPKMPSNRPEAWLSQCFVPSETQSEWQSKTRKNADKNDFCTSAERNISTFTCHYCPWQQARQRSSQEEPAWSCYPDHPVLICAIILTENKCTSFRNRAVCFKQSFRVSFAQHVPNRHHT